MYPAPDPPNGPSSDELLSRPHHDPSERYVSNPAPATGDTVTLTVEVPARAGIEAMMVRTVRDGEAEWAPGRLDRPGPPMGMAGSDSAQPGGPGPGRPEPADQVQRWCFELTCHNPITRYRFWCLGSGDRVRWLNGLGLIDHDPLDHYDFRLLSAGATPEWVPSTVWYQIFPDRFASSGRHLAHRPAWASASRWDEPVVTGPASMTQLYQGDLDGVAAHLDHLTDLGVGGIYLNPVFPGRSNHRYDATSFAVVDPVLGGDEALIRLRAACRRAGLRLISDLTLNHTGNHHEWFQAAQADATAAEASWYYFTEHPDRYASWLDVASLPKLDHAAPGLRQALYDGPDSVLARYLGAPFELDGWRVDVANMTGRRGADDHNRLVRTAARRTSDAVDRQRWLVAEHFFDPSADADHDGWHGFMNYAGVARPVASWLGRPEVLATLTGGPGQAPRHGEAVARAMDESRASVPWQVVLGSMALLTSHDTPRWQSLARSPRLARIGVGLLLSLPGSPSFLYGDEVGLVGDDAEAARRPMPWDQAQWDTATLDWYRQLIRFRAGSRALGHGGFRWVERRSDALAFLRQSRHERLLVRATRAAGAGPLSLDPGLLGASDLTRVAGEATCSRAGPRLVLDGDHPSFSIWRLESS